MCSPSGGSGPTSRQTPLASTVIATAKPPTRRNVIERMFCRLTDFRRIATRYDKRADIVLSISRKIQAHLKKKSMSRQAESLSFGALVRQGGITGGYVATAPRTRFAGSRFEDAGPQPFMK
jgi:hypothetical protein